VKLTSRGEYATRAIFYLALHAQRGFVSIGRIAEDNEMPRKYLESILNELRTEGILESREGAHGGVKLAVDPATLTVGRVLRLLDGPMGPIGCVAGDPAFCCEIEANCGTKPFWQLLTRVLDHLVDSVSFADLIDNHTGVRPLAPDAVLQIPLTPAYARREPTAPSGN
jgi:Rrf2 family protein